MLWIVLLILASATAWAQGKPEAPSVKPAKGSISYTGTYSGESTQRRGRQTASKDLEGAITLEVTFDGPAIRANMKTTGLLRGEPLSGVVEGNVCKLYTRRGALLSGECTVSGFVGTLEYSDGSNRKLEVAFDAKATRVVDAADVQRQRDQEVARRQAEAHAGRQLPDSDFTPLATKSKAARQVIIKMSGVDDLGFVAAVDDKGAWKLLGAVEWSAGVQGAGEFALAGKLPDGGYTLVVGVHNKMFQFGPGRWSFRFQLDGDGERIWEQTGGTAGGSVGIRYWRAFRLTVQKGQLTVSYPFLHHLRGVHQTMVAFNDSLIRDHGQEQSAVAAVLGAAVATLASSMAAPSAAQGCDSTCQHDQYQAARSDRAYEWANERPGRSVQDYQGP